ncbi:Pkinase-domain-containing protein [Lentithecium fluviatile CBS 122367]|uniref:non-specific serine/threonine protein kinase n=1 Tax=Lentithecium fluviatile CBS 122367 TaxID=1168545 RepID=A0A6G1JGY1_9PLEO|nr:Pkinase-domain-containing protein [Lentithecium fluviatile CBS 122367]
MESSSHGRPPTRRRRALEDATLRANEDHRSHSPRHGDKLSPQVVPTSSPKPLPHNESLVPNGTLAVRHPQPSPSPQHKRVSAVIGECRPRDPKRDSEVSNASTNASTGGRRKTHIGPWQLGKTIGKGGCSRVRLVRHTVTGQYGAAKIIAKATADKVRALSLANLANSAEHDPTLFPGGRVIPFGLEREICIMKLLDHRNIVHLYDIWENRNELYLIMECVGGGELFTYMSEHGALREIETVHIFRQIIAALYYCHRMGIHHRDLKPENILLDRETLDIKLVDFGMAALQPQGKKLTTPCGSPHYAAPEVIAMRPYDGGKADIWSCGVVLFVMLTGAPPFNYSGDDDHLKHLFRAISKADYVMPDGLSKEARHLIKKILNPKPQDRISIEKIWDHPFLHKYDKELNNIGGNGSLEEWAGPELELKEWQKLSPTTVDREILRYMRTLWHSEQEEVLIRRLVSNQLNMEKYFYSALQKYQHDQLENYVPSPHHPISYSNSDYHHNGRFDPTGADLLELPSQKQKHKRSQSGYSILHDEHLYSKHSFYAPPSEASYDPFRASRDPIIPSKENQRNVTVHRGPSSGSRKLRPATALGHRTGSSLRHPFTVAANGVSPIRLYVTVFPGELTLAEQSACCWPLPKIARKAPSCLKVRKPESPNKYINSEARKVSTELEKVMDEAFNRSSMGSSVRTSNAEMHKDAPEYDTPPTSFSNRDSGGTTLATPNDKSAYQNRPLPPTPNETPHTFLQRKIAETRAEMVHKYANVGDHSEHVSLVLDKLDRLMIPPTHGGIRVCSAPAKSPEQPGPLHVIPEEVKPDDEERFEPYGSHYRAVTDPIRPGLQGRRALTDQNTIRLVDRSPSRIAPAPLNIRKKSGASTLTRSGGDVASVPWPGPTKPSATSPQSSQKEPPTGRTNQLVSQPVAPDVTETRELTIKKKKSSWFRRNLDEKDRPQETQPKPVPSRLQIPDKWHGLDDRIKNDPLRATGPSPDVSKYPTKQSDGSNSSEFPIRNCGTALGKSEGGGALKGFFGLFGKKTKDEKSKRALELAGDTLTVPSIDNFSTSSIISGFEAESDAEIPSRPGPPDFQMNWLSRFLHIKPATKILCFEARRGKVRQVLVRQLQIWEQYGVKDVSCNNNVISARVDKFNRKYAPLLFTAWRLDGNVFTLEFEECQHICFLLQFKPVSFVIELFVVLQNGRRAHVCLARFTQTRGAATSFRKTVEHIEQVFRAQGILLEDEEKKAAMCEVLG